VRRMPGDAVPYKGQRYSALKKKARSSGQLFRDPEFPPNNKSLFCNRSKYTSIEWKRPGVISCYTVTTVTRDNRQRRCARRIAAF